MSCLVVQQPLALLVGIRNAQAARVTDHVQSLIDPSAGMQQHGSGNEARASNPAPAMDGCALAGGTTPVNVMAELEQLLGIVWNATIGQGPCDKPKAGRFTETGFIGQLELEVFVRFQQRDDESDTGVRESAEFLFGPIAGTRPGHGCEEAVADRRDLEEFGLHLIL